MEFELTSRRGVLNEEQEIKGGKVRDEVGLILGKSKSSRQTKTKERNLGKGSRRTRMGREREGQGKQRRGGSFRSREDLFGTTYRVRGE